MGNVKVRKPLVHNTSTREAEGQLPRKSVKAPAKVNLSAPAKPTTNRPEATKRFAEEIALMSAAKKRNVIKALTAQRALLKSQRVLLVTGAAKFPPTAALIEIQLQNLRQVHASLFIAYSFMDLEEPLIFSVDTVKQSLQNLEVLLPSDDALIITGAGLGSFWVSVTTAAQLAFGTIKKAPKAAFLTASLLFSSSREKGLRIMEAETVKKQEEAKQSGYVTRKAKEEWKALKTAQEKAHDDMIAARVVSARADEAYDLQLRGIKNAQDRDQLEAITKALQVFDSLQDPILKDQLRPVFVTGVRGLLGASADRILPLPPLPPTP